MEQELKKNGSQSIGKSVGGWSTKIHMIVADAVTAVTFALSPVQNTDAPEGRNILKYYEGNQEQPIVMIIDKAYDGDETRQLVFDLGIEPVVPTKSNRFNSGSTTKKYTKSGMKSNVFSAD